MDTITMATGAKVLRAALIFDRPGTVPHGIALCNWEARNEYVVWTIYLPAGADQWEAESGTYFSYKRLDGVDAYTLALSLYRTKVQHG